MGEALSRLWEIWTGMNMTMEIVMEMGIAMVC